MGQRVKMGRKRCFCEEERQVTFLYAIIMKQMFDLTTIEDLITLISRFYKECGWGVCTLVMLFEHIQLQSKVATKIAYGAWPC